MLFQSVSALVLLLGVTAVHGAPSQADVIKTARQAILKSIEDDWALGPKYLRLVFHDCVSANGCDGCVNLGQADNKGLDIPINALEKIYKPDGKDTDFSRAMSRADFWALASIVASEWGAKDSDEFAFLGDNWQMELIPFSISRTDCASSPNNPPNQDDPLPDAKTTSTKDLIKYFHDLGFTDDEMVVLMGAHSFGQAFPQNSGFDLSWTQEDWPSLDNFALHIVIERTYDWVQRNDSSWICINKRHEPGVFGDTCGFAINADMQLLLDVTPDANGMVNCDFKDASFGPDYTTDGPLCPRTNLVDIVQKYDDDAPRWWSEFVKAMDKLIRRPQSTST